MIRVFDADGNERPWPWVKGKYNLPLIDEAPRDEDHWEVVALYENTRDSSMTVRVTGDEISGIPIKFGWPDEAVIQGTNAEGHAGFGMGGGAYYRPDQGEYGPHYVEVFVGPSDRIEGLGMIGHTNHAHLEPTFQFVKGEEQPESSDNTREALVALLNAQEEGVEKTRRVLEGE